MNEWISVKDRLPENDGKYMVWCKGELDICEFDAESQTFGYTYDEYDEMYSHLVCWDDGINKKVTHWTYLPEPPESEDDAGRVTNEEIKKALEAVMHLREFCYTQDECKDCIFAGDNDFCILGLDEPTSWQTDDLLTDAAHWMPLPEPPKE